MAEYIVLIYVNITMILLYKFFFSKILQKVHTQETTLLFGFRLFSPFSSILLMTVVYLEYAWNPLLDKKVDNIARNPATGV